ALPSHTAVRERILARLQLENALADSALAHPGQPGDCPDPAVSQQPGLGRQQQPPLPLVQMRQQHLELQRQLIASLGQDRHTSPSNPKPRTTALFLYIFTERGTFWPRSRPGCRPRSRTPTGRSSTPAT